MPPSVPGHLNDEELELHSLGRLRPEDEERVEEHLLLCGECRDRLRESDQYVAAMRHALRERPAPSRPAISWRAVAALAAGLAAVAVTPSLLRPAAEVQEIRLSALRATGGAEPQLAAGRRARLRLNAQGLADGPGDVAVVSETGDVEWSGRVEIRSGSASVLIDRALAQGPHWVRLSQGGEVRREYGLSVGGR